MLFIAKVDRPVEEIKQTQKIRLYIDMMIIPAYFGYIAYKGTITTFDKFALLSLATATLVYNARNYIKNKPTA